MVPEASHENEAELLLCGLLEVDQDAQDPEEVIYSFSDEARRRLLDNLPRSEIVRVLERATQFFEKRFGRFGWWESFRAILANPALAGKFIPSDQEPFARIASQILWHVGGEFSRFVTEPSIGVLVDTESVGVKEPAEDLIQDDPFAEATTAIKKVGIELVIEESSPPLVPDEGRSWKGMTRFVRPTLIIAVGGTGTAAAKAVRARIEHFVGPRHHYVVFRAFDTTFQDNREPRLVDNSEYIYLGGFNAQSVIASIVSGQAFPHWEKWLPPRLSFQHVAFGTSGIRPIGRLCYFYRRDRVKAAIQEALTAVTDSDLAIRFYQQTGIRINLEADIDIHLIGSVCGGTGSGIFLDLAFDLRRWAEEHTNRTATVTGHLVLPEAFRAEPVVMKTLEANAYAALQELDHYMNATSDDPWIVEYVQNRPEISQGAPFDHCYLLSGLPQGGATDMETLTAVVGEAITLLTLSQAGQKISEGIINMAGQRKSTRDALGRVCCYSSYGVLGIELPEELLGESLASDLAREFYKQLLQSVEEAEAVAPEDLQSFRERMQITDFRRIDEILPPLDLDLTTINILLQGDKRKQEQGKTELQRLLAEAHDAQRRERRRLSQEDPFDEGELRRHLSDQIRSPLLRPAGLDRHLRYLARCIEALRIFQSQIREKAQELESIAEKHRSTADRLEQGNVVGKDLNQLLARAYEAWSKHVRNQTAAVVYRDQLSRIEKLAFIVQQEFIAPWMRIKDMLNMLSLAEARDEESYYHIRRARTSVGPLKWFRKALIGPNQDRLLHDVLRKLIEESRTWAPLEPKEVNVRFYDLCTEAIHHFFQNEPGMTCDHLLANCFEYPSERYKAKVDVLLSRAQANWEIHESYIMRNNRLEISAIGVPRDSTLYRTVRESWRQISPVDEQRDDYVPIFRTEHGISLPGLKRLPAYRTSLMASVVDEQRYDQHFFNDRRSVTRLDFAGEDPEEVRRLYLFSAAEILGWVRKEARRGYVGNDGLPLGRSRWEAYRNFCTSTARLVEVEIETRKQDDVEWRTRIQRQIEDLQNREQEAVQRWETTSDPFLSVDIYEAHAEIRALRDELQRDHFR